MILTREQYEGLIKAADGTRRRRNVIKDETMRWDVNEPVYYSLTAETKKDIKLSDKIKLALDTIKKYTCIKFEEVTTDEANPDKYHLQYTKSNRAASYVGKQQKFFKNKNYQEVFLAVEEETVIIPRTIMHETMHALGFNHEHERPDRDEYVEIISENIREGKAHNFVKSDAEKVETYEEPYDFTSIMHYSKDFFGKKVDNPARPGKKMKQQTIKLREQYQKDEDGRNRIFGPDITLTSGDVRKLNRLFNCRVPSKEQIDTAEKAAKSFLKGLYKKVVDKQVQDTKKQAQEYISSLTDRVLSTNFHNVKGGVCDLYEKENKDK